MAFHLTTSAAIIRKAGINANSTLTSSGAFLYQVCEEAESYLNVNSGVNFCDLYATLDSDTKMLLGQTVSDLAASYVIAADMSAYTSTREATTMLDFYRDRIIDNIKTLKVDNARVFIKNPTTTV